MDDDEIPLDRALATVRRVSDWIEAIEREINGRTKNGATAREDVPVERPPGFEKLAEQIEGRRRIIRAERRARMFVDVVEIGLGIAIALLVISLLFR